MATSPIRSGRTARTVVVVAVGALAFVAGRVTAPRASLVAADSTVPAIVASRNSSPNRPESPPASEPPPAPSGWSDVQWQSLRHQTATPDRNAALGAQLEQLARRDPAQALSLARSEPNRVLREQLLTAVVRGWAATAPNDAAHWVLHADPVFRETAWAALFASAVATDRAAAVRTGEMLIAEDAPELLGIGNHLIDALTATGDFSAAAELAQRGAPNERAAWLGEAYAKWATFQPDEAAKAARALVDPAERTAALRGVIGGWSDADPAAAVQFAVGLPADTDASAFVSQALLRWTKTDLTAASEWINSHEMGATMDRAIAEVAAKDEVQPPVAASWAENVLDPALRSEALTNVLRRWATTDLEAARRYAAATHDLTPEDRKEVAQLLATLAGQLP